MTKSRKTPSMLTSTRQEWEPLLEAVRWTLVTEGQTLLAEIFKKKSLNNPASTLLSLDWEMLHKEWLACRSRKDRVEFLAHLLCLPGFASTGFLAAIPLPQTDLRVSPSAKAQEAVILHSAPRFILEALNEWIYEILERTQSRRELRHQDRRRLQYAKRWNLSFRIGMSQGTKLKTSMRTRFLRRPVGESHVVDAYSFQLARQWLTSFWGSD